MERFRPPGPRVYRLIKHRKRNCAAVGSRCSTCSRDRSTPSRSSLSPHRNCMPPELGQCGPFRMEEVSRYDERGPAWYWNNSSMGEHTGTHFDAPIYWVTSKELSSNAVDTIPPAHFLAPARVIDCSAESAADVDFLLTIGFVEAWEARHGQIPPRSWVLLRTDWRKRPPRTYVNLSNDGPHSPGPAPAVVKWLGGARLSWFWKRNYRDRCRAGSAFQPAVPGASLYARPGSLRAVMPDQNVLIPGGGVPMVLFFRMTATMAPAADRWESGWDRAAPRSALVRPDREPLADRREEPADPTARLCAKIL
jgi:kynurenine formamidase